MRTECATALATCSFVGLLAVTVAVYAQDSGHAKTGTGPTKSISASGKSVPEPTFADVPYGKHERNILDFWQAKSEAPTPVVFIIHGGGWTAGSGQSLPRRHKAGGGGHDAYRLRCHIVRGVTSRARESRASPGRWQPGGDAVSQCHPGQGEVVGVATVEVGGLPWYGFLRHGREGFQKVSRLAKPRLQRLVGGGLLRLLLHPANNLPLADGLIRARRAHFSTRYR